MPNKIQEFLSQEPVAVAGSIAALLNAAVIAAPVFGIDLGLDATRIAEVEGAFVILLTLGAGLFARSQVVPTSKLSKLKGTGGITEAAASVLGL